jgi:hypothetical protein
MALGFLQGATGDPKSLKVRMAFQAARGIPAAEASLVDFYPFAQMQAAVRGRITRQAIEGTGAPLPDLQGKRAIPEADTPFGDLDPANVGQLLCWLSLFGAYDMVDNATWYDWQIALDGGSTCNRQLTGLVDDNINPRRRLNGWYVGSIKLDVSPNGNVAMSFGSGVEEYDLAAVPTQTAGAGSTLPVFLGMNDPQHYADPGVNITVKVNGVPTATTIPLQVKIGAAAYSHTFTVTEARLDQRVFDEGGNLIGPPGDPLRIYWPDGFSLTDADEFQLTPRRAAWTQTGLTRVSMPSVNLRWIVDGVLARVEGGYSITIGQTFRVRPDVYGEQRNTITRTGAMRVSVSATRDVSDLDWQKILHDGSNIALVLDGETATYITEGTPSIPYRFIGVLPNLVADGQQFQTEGGAENLEESLELVAGLPDSAYTYDPGYGVTPYSVSTHAWFSFWNAHATIAGIS